MLDPNGRSRLRMWMPHAPMPRREHQRDDHARAGRQREIPVADGPAQERSHRGDGGENGDAEHSVTPDQAFEIEILRRSTWAHRLRFRRRGLAGRR